MRNLKQSKIDQLIKMLLDKTYSVFLKHQYFIRYNNCEFNMPDNTTAIPNDFNAFWMPFTANRQFKSNPRMLSKASMLPKQSMAEKYWTVQPVCGVSMQVTAGPK